MHQRREVPRAMVEADGRPTLKWCSIASGRVRMPTISFDAVYRTLSFLEQHDLIRRAT